MRRTSKAATAGSTKRLGRSKPALLACVLAASVAALALVVGSASGATTRFLVEAFGSSAQPTFPADRGMAFDQGASQLYVIDSTNDTITRFNADGTAADFGALGSNVIDGVGTGDETPLGHLAFEANRQREQIAIDESGGATDGNIYATRSASDVVDVFSSSGEYLGTLSESTGTGAFGEPCGVAVDSSGNVYVGDRGDDRIHVYEPAGAVPVNADNSASFATVTDPCTLAAGSGATAGFLFVNASTGAQLRKVDAATGEVKYEIATGGSTVSVDPATGHVFVARNTGSSSQVDEYDASGAGAATLVSSFKPGQTVEGIALSSGSEQVYVARSSTENVEVFGPAAVIPDVVTSPPSSNTGVRATLAGTVNPDGVELDECFFEWGERQNTNPEPYGNIAPCAETPAAIGAGTTPVAVHADIDGLTPQGAEYSFRLLAVNPNATVNGSNQNFTTPDTVITQAATGVTPTEATLNGTVNPDGTAITECVFEVGSLKEPEAEVQQYTQSLPCVPGPGGIGAGTSPVAVEADLNELHPGATYAYRLKAANANGTIIGDNLTVQMPGPVADAWSEAVTATEATLKAAINPEGAATTYRFEYGTSATYGSQTPELAVGSDSSPHVVSRFLAELSPGTTYHYRLIATSGVAENIGPDLTFTTHSASTSGADCPNEAFRTGPSALLPDCRAYEMVSPVSKNGGDIQVTILADVRRAFNQSAISGDKITYSASTSFGDQRSSRGSNQYIATRGTSGWTTKGINATLGKTPEEPFINFFGEIFNQFKLFTPDLSTGWMTDNNFYPLNDEAPEGWMNLYRHEIGSTTYSPFVTSTPSGPPQSFEDYVLEVQAYSADFKHIVFGARRALTPDATPGTQWQLYDYAGGKLHLVSVRPDGTTAPGQSTAGTVHRGSGGAPWEMGGMMTHAVSADGSRIFFTENDSTGAQGIGPGTLYVRENPAQAQSAISGGECTEPEKACTVAISTAAGGQFWTASADGSKAIYSTGSGSAGTHSAPQGLSLFEYDADAKSSSPIAADVGGVVGASEDASYVYFTSKEDLASGATAGEWNLYLNREGTTTFIAALSLKDRTGLGEEAFGVHSAGGVDSTQSLRHAARVTPDGRHLAFMSNRPLTGYDNTDVLTGEPAMEVFLYDAVEDRLTCASCNPSGVRPEGQELKVPYIVVSEPNEVTKMVGAAWLQTWVHNTYVSRALSDDGSRLFFNAFDSLVPQDTNGAQDVYQWEADGAGSCREAGGCISLISTGKSPEKSEFVDATPDGSEVFLETSSSIDPRDPGLVDIYSARVGGGFSPPESSPECNGDSCQNIPPAPNDATPASAGFRGAGDPIPAKARGNCRAMARRATKLARRAKGLRRRSTRSGSPAKSRAARKRAARLEGKAKGLKQRSARCRRAGRRAAR